LFQILVEVTEAKGFQLADHLHGDTLVSLVSRLIKPIDVPKGNGRLARNVVERAISRQTDRIFEVIKTAGTVAQVPDILARLFFYARINRPFVALSPPALPKRLQYDCNTIAQYSTPLRPSGYKPYTIQYCA